MTNTIAGLDTEWKQSHHSCMLACYAIAGNYFTGLPIGEVFQAYCEQNRLNPTDSCGAECCCADHFNREWTRRKISGYRLLVELHQNSSHVTFTKCRGKFECEYNKRTDDKVGYETRLKKSNALLLVSFPVNGNVHTVLVAHDNDGLYVRDPNYQCVKRVDSLDEIGQLHENLFMIERPA